MERPLKILLLEDSKIDAEIVTRLLLKEKMHCEFHLAMNKKNFLLALDDFFPDVILSDNSLPGFNATDALKITRHRYLYIPFILVTGTVSEEYAANIIKEGADDYILKDRMGRLPAAIVTALKQRKTEKEIADYRYALDQSAIVAITDQKGIILYANENFCKISKYTVEELIGQDHRIINSGYHPASYIKNLWTTIANGKIWRNEFRNRAKDGSFYWVDTTIVPFLNQDGKPYQYLAIRKDITEKKKAEKQLLLSEEKYRTIFFKSPLSKWLYDPETLRFLEVNEAAVRIYGYTREEFLNMTIKDIRPKEDVELLLNDLDKIQDGADIRHGNWRHLKKNGEIIIVETTAHSLDYNNRKARMVVVNDITERKRVEADLIGSEEKYRTLVEQAADGIFIADMQGRFITVNPKACNISQYAEKELKQMTFFDLSVAEDIQRNPFRFGEMQQGKTVITERLLKRKDGTIVDVETTGKILNDGRMLVFVRDITERKKAEEALRQSEMALQEAQAIAHICNWGVDLVQNVHTWSDEFYRIYGLNKGEVQPSTEFFLSYMHPEDAALAQKKVQEAFVSFKDSSFNFRFIRKDGIVRHGYTEWKFEIDNTGNPVRLFGILQDITERRETENKLKILEDKILGQKIEEQKKIARALITGQEKERNYIGQELHDNINQILAGTKMYLSIAGKKNEELKELIKYPMELIDSSIAEIRLLCSKLVTPLKNIDLEELIRDLLNKLGQNKMTKTIFTYAVPVELLSDALKLNIYRIVQEQVNNILKYAEAKNVCISIKTQDKTIRIHVEDDGKGFDVKSKRKGIGISNIINRAETFNGQVNIKSSPGNGCKIVVTIPC